MWHEARKQERKIRGMLVDYRKRAERRRDFYEKIRADPTQFLQLHGRQCKIHLDPNVAAAADSPAAMMPWQGQTENLIDRFDVRAHLDIIHPITKSDDDELTYDERQLNYERYRIIAQNSFLGITEEKFLKQLHLEEQFGYTENEKNKNKKMGGAAIGFNYEDGTVPPPSVTQGNSSDEQSDSDLDVDLAINVSKMDPTQAHEMNRHGRNFGMSTNDFYSFLTNDMEEAENYRLAKEEEHEKALFSGRKSRRERRAHREKRLANRVLSPPSYAARTSPTYPILRLSKSASKSPSPENTGKITYITSFGDEDEPCSSSKPTYADKVKYGKSKKTSADSNKEHRIVYFDVSAGNNHERHKKRPRLDSSGDSSPRRSKERRRSSHRYRRSRSKQRAKRYRRRSSSSSSSSSTSSSSTSSSRSRHRSRRNRNHSRSTSRSDYRSRRRSYTRSRSKSKGNSKNSRSRSRSKSNSKRRSRSRSRRSRSRSRSISTRKQSRSLTSKSRSSSGNSRSRTQSSHSHSSLREISSKSRSPSIKKESPPKVMTRYYGRKRSDQSSSDLSDGDDGAKDVMEDPPVPITSNKSSGNSGTSTKKSSTNLSLQERLRRKRQALLNKQFKADKIAEQLKTEREKQEQQNREEELREMAIKLRRRQREIRHAYESNTSSSSDTEGKPASPIPTVEYKRSRSPSPNLRDDRERKSKEPRESKKYSDSKRERNRDRDRESTGRRSPKSRYDSESKSSYKTEGDRERSYRKRDEYSDSRRDNYKSRDHGRSLVDY